MVEPTLIEIQAQLNAVLVELKEKQHAIEHFRIAATTTNATVTFTKPATSITITTSADVIIAFKEYADVNRDIRLQSGQSLTLEGVQIRSVSAITSAGTANVDVIGVVRIA